MKYSIICFVLICMCLSACQTGTDSPKSAQKAVETSVVEKPKEEVKKRESTPPPKASKTAANRWKADEYRNKNWKPKEGQYFFSEQWIWEFENEFLKENDPARKGTISVYVDPPSGMILLTRGESKYTDEMTDWLMIHPDGLYLTGMTDEHGKKTMRSKRMSEFPDYKMIVQQQQAAFDAFFKKEAGLKVFGKDDLNNPTIEGEEYSMKKNEEESVGKLYLGKLPFSMRAFYLVQKTNEELGFPINTQYGYLLPDKAIVLSEEFYKGDRAARSYLKSMSGASHFLDISTYKLIEEPAK